MYSEQTMNFDSATMMADIYEEQVRSMVGSVVTLAAGASMLLTRGRTIREFRAKLAELGDEERKRLVERYPGTEGKYYETDSWRGLWDKILDTAYAMDARGNHRARAMSKYGEFLDVAEAIEARSPDALPSAIVTYSRALTDLQRRAKNADLDRDRAKLLAVVSESFVRTFDEIGGKRRITGSRADAEVIDAAIVAACAKEKIDVASGVVPAPKPRVRAGEQAQKRSRGGGTVTDEANATLDKTATDDRAATTADLGGVCGDDHELAPDTKTRKIASRSESVVLTCFEQMKEKIGDHRAASFVEWLVKESQNICRVYPDQDVSAFTIINSVVTEDDDGIVE
jgi:hypothetical protein